jgi:hypothetical protein
VDRTKRLRVPPQRSDRFLILLTIFFSVAHDGSIGEKSGEFAGPATITSTRSSSHSMLDDDGCAGASSCWDIVAQTQHRLAERDSVFDVSGRQGLIVAQGLILEALPAADHIDGR